MIFIVVVAVAAATATPEALPVAVKGTQLITPAEVDCRTEAPVAGLVAGNVYIVLPVADDTNAV